MMIEIGERIVVQRWLDASTQRLLDVFMKRSLDFDVNRLPDVRFKRLSFDQLDLLTTAQMKFNT